MFSLSLMEKVTSWKNISWHWAIVASGKESCESRETIFLTLFIAYVFRFFLTQCQNLSAGHLAFHKCTLMYGWSSKSVFLWAGGDKRAGNLYSFILWCHSPHWKQFYFYFFKTLSASPSFLSFGYPVDTTVRCFVIVPQIYESLNLFRLLLLLVQNWWTVLLGLQVNWFYPLIASILCSETLDLIILSVLASLFGYHFGRWRKFASFHYCQVESEVQGCTRVLSSVGKEDTAYYCWVEWKFWFFRWFSLT